ncbi:hypothetical protein OAP88_02020 [Candidatus Pelagibacter sp.]|nr:hypothetical protein [Candidatus Pelagibacter sp.]
MSTESLNRTSDVIKDPSQVISSRVNIDVLKQKSTMISKKKRTCVNTLNKRLHLVKRKDKLRNIAIVSGVFISAGLLSIIVG